MHWSALHQGPSRRPASERASESKRAESGEEEEGRRKIGPTTWQSYVNWLARNRRWGTLEWALGWAAGRPAGAMQMSDRLSWGFARQSSEQVAGDWRRTRKRAPSQTMCTRSGLGAANPLSASVPLLLSSLGLLLRAPRALVARRHDVRVRSQQLRQALSAWKPSRPNFALSRSLATQSVCWPADWLANN